PRTHWIALLEKSGVPTGLYQTVAEMVSHPQVQARHMLTTVTTPTGQPLRVASNPLLNTTGQSVVRRQPPALDADRAAILQELGM
ncbi:MAG: CoA transferase, partial [Comamonas sp.]